MIAPALNEQDVDEIPEHLRKDLDFRFVSEIERGAGDRAPAPPVAPSRRSAPARAGGQLVRRYRVKPSGLASLRMLSATSTQHRGSDMASRRRRLKRRCRSIRPIDLSAITKANPYIQRLIEDAQLRDNVRKAIESSRSAYEPPEQRQGAARRRCSRTRSCRTSFAMRSKRRGASAALTEAPKQRRRRRAAGFGRKLHDRRASAVALALVAQREAALQGARHRCSAPRRSSSTRRLRARRPLRLRRRSAPRSRSQR